MSNCSINTILCNESGFAALCPHCSSLHIGFGNFLLVIERVELPDFITNMANNYRRRSADNDNRMVKNIVIPSPTKEVSLLFCLNELERFISFLEQIHSRILMKSLAVAGVNLEDSQLN